MTEWRPIKGYEGFYEVSDDGQVRSLARVIVKSNGVPKSIRARLLAPQHSQGRIQYQLKRAGTRRAASASVLVAEAFLGPRPQGMLVRHLDDIPTNNHVSNLAYGTQVDNMKDCVRNGNHPKINMTHCRRGHVLASPNLCKQNARQPNRRRCWSCTKATMTRARWLRCGDVIPPDFDVNVLADRYYASLKLDAA